MSGASMLRNAVKRITHKERAQPSDRKKLGLLEKHKDYVERATNFKNKQKYLKNLRRKAAERNEDEFYFHMHKSQLKNGKHVETAKSTLDKETIDLMKTQDLAYIIHKKQVDQRKVERLRESIQLIGEMKPRKHMVFVDNEEELETFDPAVHFDTVPELLERSHNRLRTKQLDAIAAQPNSILCVAEQDQVEAKQKKRKISEEMKEIKQRSKRARHLEEAYFELSQQRQLATSKGAKKKIEITTTTKGGKEKKKVIYKWRRERAK